MRNRNFKIRTLAVIAAASVMFSSVPVYAEEQVDVDVSSETDYSGENSGSEQENYASEVVELTVTIEEITSEPTDENETPEENASETKDDTEALEDIASEPTDNIETSEDIPESEDSTEAIDNTDSQTEHTDAESDTTIVDLANDGANNGEKYSKPLEKISETYDDETNQFTSELNYTKALSNFTVSQSSTGRYNAQFVITETEVSTGTVKQYNYTVSGFKTPELAKAYADAVEATGRYRSGETEYVISDANLIDAEKRPLENDDVENGYYGDLYLCWAGSTSDMLELSGWNKAVGHNYNNENVTNEDTLLDLFSKYFTNDAGNPWFGLEWFFNGINRTQGGTYAANGWAQVRNSDDGFTAPMLKEYCSSDFIEDIKYPSEQEFNGILSSLDKDEDGDRCAIGLVFGYYKCDVDGNPLYDGNGELIRKGGHCVTIVGYSTDENGVPKTITIADSDTYDLGNGEPDTPASNRSSYKNTYTTYPVEFYDGYWHIMNYYKGNGYDNIIDELVLLKYYSDNTKDKTEQGGTTNIDLDYDFYSYGNTLYYNGEMNDYVTVYQGDKLEGILGIENRGLKKDTLSGTPVTYSFVISKDGTVVKTLNYSEEIPDISLKDCTIGNILMDADNPLEEGEYTVSYIFNYDRSIQEAYYNNNESIYLNKFIVIKRVAPSGDIDYIVIPDVNEDSSGNEDNNNVDEYQEMITEFITHINDYSVVVDQNAYENDKNKTFEFTLENNAVVSDITEADLINAEICFDYSISGNTALSNGSFGGNITSNIALTKNDYNITRNADGTLSMVFTNEFMRKLPKGTHYFKLIIAGKSRLFKIEIK